jgi:pyoverdine/dityrosine biosynthesis protein Dit1
MVNAVPHLTPLEQAWSDLRPGHRVSLDRTDQYDFRTGLFHSPAQYLYSPIASQSVSVSQDDLLNRLNDLVHPGLSDQDMPTRCPTMAQSDQRQTISEEVLHQLLRNSESSLVYGGIIDDLITLYKDDRALQILGMLSHPLLGNKRNRDFLRYAELSDLVSRCLSERLPFQLLLPAFPFKDQNPFRTGSAASHWDIGEAALLIRLHCLALGLNQLHAYDGECLIVSDGRAYSSMFGIRESEANEYLQGLRELRNSLNLQRTIHIIDLKSLIDKADRSFTIDLDGNRIIGLRKIFNTLEDRLEALSRSNELAASKLAGLGESMIWNIETRTYLERINAPTLWRAMNLRCKRLDRSTVELRDDLKSRSWRVGLRYAAFNMSLTLSGFWRVMFPDSIRSTVHAKPGQAAIPKLGRGDPWNAVGVIEDGGLGAEAVKTMPLWKLSSAQYKPVFLAGSHDPVAMVKRSVVSALVNR